MSDERKPQSMSGTPRTLSIADEFSKTPGARYRTDGPKSGEEFRDTMLVTAFERAVEENAVLLIDLDGGYGYSTGFLEEVFGGLARLHGSDLVQKHLAYKSDDEPRLTEDISNYVTRARRTK